AWVRFLGPPPGELREVLGMEEAFAQEGIRGIRIYRRPGHRFGEFRRGADRAGAVLAVGDSREEALERAARAEGMIRFETVDVEALVFICGSNDPVSGFWAAAKRRQPAS